MSKSKYLDLAGLTAYDGKIKEWIKSGVVDITNDAINALFVTVAEGPADNEIWCTSTNDKIVKPYKTNVFGANIVSNTYDNGKGVITFDGPVTSIGGMAFYNRASLVSITIPNSVQEIGYDAFRGCDALTSVTIPNSVTSIGYRSFQGCNALPSITIPNSVTIIGVNAFYGCDYLTSVTIGNSVTTIGGKAFSACPLTSITIPNSVTSIGDEAFAGCSSLTSITFDGTKEQWNAISKGSNWSSNVPATNIQCSDGQAQL